MNNPNSVRGIPPRNAESFDFKGEPGSPNAAPSATDPRARLYDGSITSSGPAARQVVGRNEERVFFLDTVATGDVAVNEVTPPVHANNSRQVVVTTRIREVAVMLLVLLVEVDCRRGGIFLLAGIFGLLCTALSSSTVPTKRVSTSAISSEGCQYC